LTDHRPGAQASRTTGGRIGIVAELKHAAYFDGIGLPFERTLLPLLERHGVGRGDAFFIESFEPGVLERLRPRVEVGLVQLIAASGGPADRPGTRFSDMTADAGLRRIAAMRTRSGPTRC
jgi:glycerophosphoryl diester phosphodiesterase